MALFQNSRRLLRSMPVRFCSTRTGLNQETLRSPLSQSSSQKAAGFPLPTTNALNNVPQQGWQFSTSVGQSNIAQAGNGRFAAEAIKAGSVVVQKPLVPMSSIDSLSSLANDTTITFSNVAELEKYIEMSKTEGGHSREVVLDLFEHFIYGFNGEHACLNISTWTVNHGDNTRDGLNVDVVEKTLPGGAKALVGEAMIDIKVGDEFYMDYRKFKLPQFYIDYTEQHGFKDVRTATVEAVYGSAE